MLHIMLAHFYQSPRSNNAPAPNGAWSALFAAWVISLLATSGALFLGEVMGMAPCLLCWYQRIAMFPLVLILGAALIGHAHAESIGRLSAVALLLALIGWAIATYHTLLYWDWITPAVTPCGAGPSCKQQNLQILGFLDIPMLSWFAFSGILLLTFFSMKVNSRE